MQVPGAELRSSTLTVGLYPAEHLPSPHLSSIEGLERGLGSGTLALAENLGLVPSTGYGGSQPPVTPGSGKSKRLESQLKLYGIL